MGRFLVNVLFTGITAWVFQLLGWIQIPQLINQSWWVQILGCLILALVFSIVTTIIVAITTGAGLGAIVNGDQGCACIAIWAGLILYGPIFFALTKWLVPGVIVVAGGKFIGTVLVSWGLTFIPMVVTSLFFGVPDEAKQMLNIP